MTKAQQRFHDTTPNSGWPWDCLSGSEAAMARRMVSNGDMVEVHISFQGSMLFRSVAQAKRYYGSKVDA